jgi:hypothetical protein
MVSDAQDFLEVQRFDRIGLTGRVGMLSAVAVDDEYQGIVPAYDILPMRYASIGGGVDPELTTIEPKGGGSIGAWPEVWGRAHAAAARFWTAVQGDELGWHEGAGGEEPGVGAGACGPLLPH